MKRGGAPKRRAQLRADPEKTRAFVRRGRENGHLGRPEALLRAAAAVREVASPPQRKRRLRVAFRPVVPASRFPCARCGTETGRRAAHWHHWLEQEHLKTYARGLRVSDESARAILRKLLHDRRNLVALCVDCHLGQKAGSRPLSGELVPHEAKIFALELGTEWAERLARRYPGGQRQ